MLDFLFPKRCVQCKSFGAYICANCFVTISFDVPLVCLECNKPAMMGITHPMCMKRNSIDGSLAGLVYKGIVKKLIYQFKYKPYIADLRKTLADLFYEGLIQHEQLYRILAIESVLVPIPLYSSKLRERGYNQAGLLADAFGRQMNIPMVVGLERVRKTAVQSSLSKDKRIENIRNAFIVSQRKLPLFRGRQVLLVDDIITSGATMREAASALKKAGVTKVWGIALAHGV